MVIVLTEVRARAGRGRNLLKRTWLESVILSSDASCHEESSKATGMWIEYQRDGRPKKRKWLKCFGGIQSVAEQNSGDSSDLWYAKKGLQGHRKWQKVQLADDYSEVYFSKRKGSPAAKVVQHRRLRWREPNAPDRILKRCPLGPSHESHLLSLMVGYQQWNEGQHCGERAGPLVPTQIDRPGEDKSNRKHRDPDRKDVGNLSNYNDLKMICRRRSFSAVSIRKKGPTSSDRAGASFQRMHNGRLSQACCM